jgi:BCD family chlorophyll transporter-like MFS transporter
MMSMAGEGGSGREGTRMGLWGAAQGIAFGLGGFGGTVAIDMARALIPSTAHAYAVVFGMEAALFFASAWIATRISSASGVGIVWRTPSPPTILAPAMGSSNSGAGHG